jgi:hypothetical protein
VHIVLLTVMAACLILFRRWVISIHGWMFKVEEEDLKRTYFQFLAYYEIMVIAFFAVPWVVLRFLV